MAKFFAKCENQVVVITPNRKQVFDGIPMPVPGKRIQFSHGEYETEDKKEIEFLRKHRLYKVSISEAEEPKLKAV
jgi:hypothetical protein